MTDPGGHWPDIEQEEREAIVRQLEEEARSIVALPARDRSVLAMFRGPLELAFATVIGVLCGLISVLAAVVIFR